MKPYKLTLTTHDGEVLDTWQVDNSEISSFYWFDVRRDVELEIEKHLRRLNEST